MKFKFSLPFRHKTVTVPSTSGTRHSAGVGLSRRPFVALSYGLTIFWATLGGLAVAMNPVLVQVLEREAQSFLFELRGPLPAPEDIVILTIDEQSLAQEQMYRSAPDQHPYLEPLQAWPWKRTAYATMIERLMQAGARAVALDIIFANPSIYGPEDDARFRQVLTKYAKRVVLAANYENAEDRAGETIQLVYPIPELLVKGSVTGFVNYWVEPNGRIHQLGRVYPQLLAASYPDPLQAQEIPKKTETTPSFAQATLRAARLAYPEPFGDNIFFYGPSGTFEQIPFWHVLDPNNWNTYLQKGQYFKNKIVLVGATATILQDFHAAPFSKTWRYPVVMSGIEIHANSIATLLEDRSLREAIPDLSRRGVVVGLGLLSAGLLLRQIRRVWVRSASTFGVLLTWIGISYICFISVSLFLPTAVPVLMISCNSLSQLLVGAIGEQRNKRRLRQSLKQYASSPIVQEIISQHGELQDLVLEREQELLGTRLGSRYRVIKVLGSGGFGETYIAEDTQRPGNPRCVVKQLRPMSGDPKNLQVARRLFQKEAETLEKLGKHDRIPQLLAYFEENQEFYLVQELIEGHPLTKELPLGRQIPELQVIHLLQDLLQTLGFVHSQHVIHRDIKPSNIIRRESDNALVLIDFGAVKEIRTQLSDEDQAPSMTIGIGTRGYTPTEQTIGNPRLNSDIYALGMTAIRALTGLPPDKLREDPRTGQIFWEHKTNVSRDLIDIINKMVHQDFRERYQSASDVLADLDAFAERYNRPLPLIDLTTLGDEVIEDPLPTVPVEDDTASSNTQPWMSADMETELSSSQTVPHEESD